MPRKSETDKIVQQATLGHLLMKDVPAVKDKEAKSDLAAVGVAVLLGALSKPPADNMDSLGSLITKALKYAYNAGKNS